MCIVVHISVHTYVYMRIYIHDADMYARCRLPAKATVRNCRLVFSDQCPRFWIGI